MTNKLCLWALDAAIVFVISGGFAGGMLAGDVSATSVILAAVSAAAGLWEEFMNCNHRFTDVGSP